MLISLFCAPNRLNELPHVHFEYPFNLIGKSTMAFLTGAYSNPATWVGAQNNDFGAVLQTDLTRV